MKKLSLILALIMLFLCACSEETPAHAQKEDNNAVSVAQTVTETEAESSTLHEEDSPVIEYQGNVPGCLAEKYTMVLTLDTENHNISGNVVAELVNTTDAPLSQVCFRLFSVSASSGSIRKASNPDTGKEYKLSPKAEDASVIYIDLGGDAIDAGAAATVSLDFISDIPMTDGRFGYHMENGGTIYNMTFCFPQIAYLEDGKWFEDAYIAYGEVLHNAMADYSVTLTAPEDYVILSSGRSVTDKGVTVIDAPNIREMAITACNFADVESVTDDGITYNIMKPRYEMGSPELLEDFYDLLLTVSTESVKIFSEKIGDYIYDELDIIPLQLPHIGGMEMPGLVQIGIPTFPETADLSIMPSVEATLSATCHEVGHQWFYCAVGNNQSSEPWLDESFTSYLEYYYIYKSEDGRTAAENFGKKHLGKEVFMISPFEGSNDFTTSSYINMKTKNYSMYDYGIVYKNGAWFLRGLELAMGEEIFFEMLSDWYEENTNDIVKGSEFINHLLKYSSTEEVKTIINQYISDENL